MTMFREYMETLLEAGRRKQVTRVAITRKTKIQDLKVNYPPVWLNKKMILYMH